VGPTPHCTEINRPHAVPDSHFTAESPDGQRHDGNWRLLGNADIAEIVIQHERVSSVWIAEL
jgi:hypothetical protein